MCLSNLVSALGLVIRPKHLFRMVSFDVRLGTLHMT